jgi:hypothetical protein
MTVRFFGGWGYATLRTGADAAYAKGVPTGGDLPKAPNDGARTDPAMKNPQGGNRDRFQIIKGWVDKRGERRTRRSTASSGVTPTAASVGQTANCRAWELQSMCGRNLDKYDRRLRTRGHVKGSGFRSEAARVLLRALDRDSHFALDRLRLRA